MIISLWGLLLILFFCDNCYLSRNLIGQFAVVDKSSHNAARVNVSRNAFFSSQKHFLWRWYYGKKQIECGLALSVLLSTIICIILEVKICCGLTRLRLVSPHYFDHCDDDESTDKANHVRFVKEPAAPGRSVSKCAL